MNKPKKKILWITNNWLFDYGGRKIASKKILNFLSQQKYQVTVLDFEIGTEKKSKSKKNLQLDEDISFNPIYLPDNKRIIFEHLKFAKNKTFDFIVISGVAPTDLITITVVRLAKLYQKAKLILFAHTNSLQEIKLSKFRLMHRLLASFFYKQVDSIVTPGKSLRQLFIDKLKIRAEKIQVINYPIIDSDLNIYSNDNITKIFLGKKQFKIVITSARLNLEQKDFETLFKAFKIARSGIRNLRLVILGNGPDRKKIEEMAKNIQIKDGVVFLGFQKNPFKFMARSDLFVLSSRFEGFGISLIEAMACGVPVVSSDSEVGPREIVENNQNGLLYPIGDEKKLARLIIKILRNRNLKKKLVTNGRARAREYLSEKSLISWAKLLIAD